MLARGSRSIFLSSPLTTFRLLATQPESMNVFDRRAKLLQRERALDRSGDNPKTYEYLREEVGYRLADRVFDIKRTFKTGVELGCGLGHVGRYLNNDNVENYILCDASERYLEKATEPEGIPTRKIKVDEENEFNFNETSIDLVLSCLSLHWVNNLPGTFKRIQQSLQPDGVFLAALLGGDTLYELRGSLQLAELERRGGVSPHISPFAHVRDIGGLMHAAGFVLLTIDTDDIVINYPSIYELINDVRGMGESNATWNRALHLGRDTMLSAASLYKSIYGKKDPKERDCVPATFQIIYLVGWKPDSSQPRPLERGSGEINLKDIFKKDNEDQKDK